MGTVIQISSTGKWRYHARPSQPVSVVRGLLPAPQKRSASIADIELARDMAYYQSSEQSKSRLKRAWERGRDLTRHLSRAYGLSAESPKVRVRIEMLGHTPLETMGESLRESGLTQWRKLPDYYFALAHRFDRRMEQIILLSYDED